MSNNFNSSNILVSGGAGFVGSNLVKLILKENESVKVTVIDNLLSAEEFNLPKDQRLTFIKGSISDDSTLVKVKDEFDYIFHLATFHGNQSSIHDPLKDHQNNTLTTLKLFEHLKDSKALKIIHPQDEWIFTDILNEFINEFKIDHVFSVAPPSEWPIIYSKVDRTKVKFHLALTGYLDDNSISKLLQFHKRTKRDIDVGYRATKAAEWYGSHGFLKTQIGDLFKKEAPKAGFKVDISNEEKDRILGDGWYEFLARCKYVIGVEGGSTVLDPKGEIYFKGKAYKEAHPNATFTEVEQNCFPGQDGNLQLIAISPRHIECCALKTCQVLIEGYYNGILEPEKHYIPLKGDFSNLDEVFKKMRDNDLRERIVEQAYKDIVVSNKYTYSNYVKEVLSLVDERKLKGKGFRDAIYHWINRYYDKMFWINQNKKSPIRALNSVLITIYIYS